MNIELGLVDSIWDVSLHTDDTPYIKLNASLGGTNGWYHSLLKDGKLYIEQRMRADGNYDHQPESSRPPITSIIAAIPEEHHDLADLLRSAYDAEIQQEQKEE